MSDNAPVPMPTRSRMQILDAVRGGTGGGFDVDAWHVMDQRDNALISDEIMNGSGSNKFIYTFPIAGSSVPVTGISVIGARHLAAHYGGIKHRLIASIQKIGSLFTFTSYPQPQMPMSVQCSVVHELEAEDDFYGAIIEISDIKTGNTIQVEKRESRYERKRDGSKFERPHYSIIAQSKAYRNGVLSIISQDVQMEFKLAMLKLGREDIITTSVMQEKRNGILRFAASKALHVDRQRIEALTMSQISGLSDAVRVDLDSFKRAAESLAVIGQAQSFAEVPRVAQEVREQPKSVAQPIVVARSPDAPKTETKPAQVPAKPVFEANLIDAMGELSEDVYSDAGLFAEALVELIDRKEGDPETLIENNQTAIRACMAFPNAAGLLKNEIDYLQIKGGSASMTQPGAAEQVSKPPVIEAEKAPEDTSSVKLIDLPGGNGRGIDVWLRSVSQALPILTAATMPEWIGLHRPIWAKLPEPRKLEAERMVSARCKAIGLNWAGTQQPVQNEPGPMQQNGDPGAQPSE